MLQAYKFLMAKTLFFVYYDLYQKLFVQWYQPFSPVSDNDLSVPWVWLLDADVSVCYAVELLWQSEEVTFALCKL